MTDITDAILELEQEIPDAYVQDSMDGPVIILSEKSAKTALAALKALSEVGYEYGTRWPLSEEAHGPGKVKDYLESSEEQARLIIEQDRVANHSDKPRGKLIRRRTTSPWEVIEL